MDRNSIIGIVLIAAILIGYGIISSPSKEQIEKNKQKRDSLERVYNDSVLNATKLQNEKLANTATIAPVDSTVADSLKKETLSSQFGVFSNAAEGENEFFTLENSNIKATISSKGGRLYSVELKKYKRYDSLPLILFDGDSTVFGLKFFAQNRSISTNEMYFKKVDGKNPNEFAMRLYAEPNKYLEYAYRLDPDSFMLKLNVNFVGLKDIISDNSNYLTLDWNCNIHAQEKGVDFENTYTGLYYKFYNEEVDNLSETSESEEETIRTKLKWIGYKQQFFSSVLIAEDAFQSATISSKKYSHKNLLKILKSEISIPYEAKSEYNVPLKFYFGPNHYNTLIAQGENLELERLVPLGWGFFLMQWINRFAVIPVFNFLENYISNYGIIILILTILLKLVLFPLTYKSYQSTAKMRVLKPQIDEINAKIPKEKTMERQQATMALYKKVGVNPMGGCLPMLLQFPILIAMFRFFPASIELRQKSFLWADDLSSYDSIANLPFEIPFYGSHVSLFTILMTISTLIYTHIQNKNNPSQNSMPGMKVMMYIMPIMFLFWFNSYASGLSYYYFLANVITFTQMELIRRFMIDDAQVLQKLQEAKAKPAKKKSSFQEKLEKMARERANNRPKR